MCLSKLGTNESHAKPQTKPQARSKTSSQTNPRTNPQANSSYQRQEDQKSKRSAIK
ncbi:1037_t:CDS:2 [Cetraspora pellucida]|uniref:1037_t:CDS:1 n=1 Tax=Cetraspora pellucida TaxID=1433469 RepID=A0A9N9N7Y4_9GLOM|nr:1037_t:CDS:2 [Cetraspora pellucida]